MEANKLEVGRMTPKMENRVDPDTKSFSCYAVSEALGETIVQTYTVAVVYPPSAPSISGYEAGKPIKAGDLQKLSCVSSGGNPPATLKWFKNDKEVSFFFLLCLEFCLVLPRSF
ncbi:nephrin [Nephila pilipes]|uniref:Nephrin n=1 Tax=Nephila pilipes TaxID=299642 RepID=A0A8X6PY62_NEPPI|nr:nephrin [Nephila pilipes]GFT91647.1 nephrin [Nephila pilipes]